MANALILGANTATGAYLARLLHARGTAVFGVPDDSGVDAPTALGITDSINPVSSADVARLAAALPDLTLYALNTGTAAQAAFVAETIAAALTARLCHIVDHDRLRHHPALLEQAKSIAALRRDAGRPAVNAILHAHDSRLGPPDALPARIIAAAHRASLDPIPSQVLEITETGPMDWGWTPEYVDAIARLAALPARLDLAIGSGHTLTVHEFADLAFAFFKADPTGHIHITPATTPPEPPIDAARLKAATGWSASTWGRDLVHALCEGAGTRPT